MDMLAYLLYIEPKMYTEEVLPPSKGDPKIGWIRCYVCLTARDQIFCELSRQVKGNLLDCEAKESMGSIAQNCTDTLIRIFAPKAHFQLAAGFSRSRDFACPLTILSVVRLLQGLMLNYLGTDAGKTC